MRYNVVKRMKRFSAAVLAFLFLLTACGSRGQKEGTEALSASGTAEETQDQPKIALTFDDGPNAQFTPELLDGLREREVKATFFVIGVNIEKDGNGELIRRMYEEGHLIGNHTYSHCDLSKLSEEEAETEILRTDRLVKDLTGSSPWLLRPPFGNSPCAGEDPDKIYVKWTLDSCDWMLKDSGKITERVVTQAEEDDIILMHDCYGTSVEAALTIIDILQERGFEFVTVDRLLTD